MIDDEVDFGNIIDTPTEVQTTAKFRPKVRVKPRKPSAPSRSQVPNPTTVERTAEGLGTLRQDHVPQGLTINKETTSLTCLGSNTVGDANACRGVATDVDRVSQNEGHNDDLPEVAMHQTSSTHLSGKTIDDSADFGGPMVTQVEEERVPSFQPKIVELSMGASKLQNTNQRPRASTVDLVSQNKEDGNNQTRCNNAQLQDPRHKKSIQISEFQTSLGTDNSTVDNLANLDNTLEEPIQKKTDAKFRPTLRSKPGRFSSRFSRTDDKAAPEVGFSDVDLFSQDRDDDRHNDGHNDDLCQKPADQHAITVSNSLSPQDIVATVDSYSHDDLTNPYPDDTQLISGEPSADATVNGQPNVGRKKQKQKSVSFVLPDSSKEAAPTTTNSGMSNFSHNCDDIAIDENLNNLPQETTEKQCVAETQDSIDQEYTDRPKQHHEGEPSDHVVEQQPEIDVRETILSMKLRSSKKMQKNGILEHNADLNVDEDYVEPSAAKEGNDSGDEYIVGGKKKVRRKSRDKDINKEPLEGSKNTSKDTPVEELQQQKLQKNKSKVSSQSRKRTMKDISTEQPEKKLTHRIRQKRMKEVKTLLETPDHEIDRMKLSVTHLRLLQEARERIKGKEISSGPPSYQSSQPGDMDDFDSFGIDNYDNDRTEDHVLENTTKLNYHSYMSKQSRAKWSKSDMDLFYQGLQQFGSDFAMIQQLFPDKTRDQVRQKFKSEEKKNPMQVHDAIIHRSRDNLYFRKVIQQLNIEDVQQEMDHEHKLKGASNEGDLGHEDAFDDSINEVEENCSNWSEKEQDMQRSVVKEGEDVSASADDDLDDVFDWY